MRRPVQVKYATGHQIPIRIMPQSLISDQLPLSILLEIDEVIPFVLERNAVPMKPYPAYL